jgi:hypothetical protein
MGVFAKFWKVAIIFVMSACLALLPSAHPSVLMELLGFHWTYFHDMWFFIIFWKSVQKIQISLISDKNNGYFTWRPLYVFYHLVYCFLEAEMFLTKIVEKTKTHQFNLSFMGPCILRILSNKMQRYTVYFIWKLLYMFRVVPPPIIRSAYNCIYSIWYLSHRYCYLPLSWKSWNCYAISALSG